MGKIRVMIVDGEVATRRRIGQGLEADIGLEVVATCSLGETALDKLRQFHPDLVVLSLADHSTSGVEMLSALRAENPRLPILVASPDARRGSPLALDVISSGASGYVTLDGIGLDAIGADLCPKIHALLPRTRVESAAWTNEPHSRPRPSRRIEAVLIGTSTGGPDALAALFPRIPPNLPVPILIVQHMPSGFTKGLAERLDAVGSIRVREAVDGEIARPGTAWIAPAGLGMHLTIRMKSHTPVIRLERGSPGELFCPSADALFRGASQSLDGRVLAVVLTGMGSDGLHGAREIRASGGCVIVQDETSSIVWGMPKHVVEHGLAQSILPLDQIGTEIVRLSRVGRHAPDEG